MIGPATLVLLFRNLSLLSDPVMMTKVGKKSQKPSLRKTFYNLIYFIPKLPLHGRLPLVYLALSFSIYQHAMPHHFIPFSSKILFGLASFKSSFIFFLSFMLVFHLATTRPPWYSWYS